MSTLGLVLRNIKITWSICYKCRFPRLISCLLKPSLMVGPRWFFMLLNSLHHPWEGPWVNFSTRTAYGRSGFLSRRRRPQDRLIAEEKCDEPGWWCSSVLPAPAFALPENMLEVQTSCPVLELPRVRNTGTGPAAGWTRFCVILMRAAVQESQRITAKASQPRGHQDFEDNS